MKSLVFVASIGLFISVAVAQPRCAKPHQVWKDCGTTCEPSCQNPKPTICTMMCKNGCFCQQGFVEDGNGNCINPKDCPVSSPPVTATLPPPKDDQCNKPNQEFKQCGSMCVATCENPDLSNVACPEMCVRGCFCKAGFVKDAAGNCVELNNCPAGQSTTAKPGQCKDGEEWNECGSACPETCDVSQAQMACIAMCVRGCFCKNGLVRNSQGKCVPKEKCAANQPSTAAPGKCGRNEELVECPTPCPATCENMNETGRVCAAMCMRQGCQCKRGFVKNAKGQCILPAHCNKGQCGLNEVWSNSSCVAPRECQNPQCSSNTPKVCMKICQQGGCVCKPNMFRDNNGNCVTKRQCDRQSAASTSTAKPATATDPCNPNPCGPNRMCRPIQCFVPPCNPAFDCSSGLKPAQSGK